MSQIIQLTDLSAPELDVYARLTDAQLRSRLEPEKGVFIAESPKVIDHGPGRGIHAPLPADGAPPAGRGTPRDLLARCPDVPVYTGSAGPAAPARPATP